MSHHKQAIKSRVTGAATRIQFATVLLSTFKWDSTFDPGCLELVESERHQGLRIVSIEAGQRLLVAVQRKMRDTFRRSRVGKGPQLTKCGSVRPSCWAKGVVARSPNEGHPFRPSGL
jgi:hypothetical protein